MPICLACTSADEIVATVAALAPSFGGINLEDISAPRCFEIEDRLRQLLDIPVFHDHQHGTAIVTLAALRSAARVARKELGQLRAVVAGTGASSVAVTKMLLRAGIGDIAVSDSKGAVAAAVTAQARTDGVAVPSRLRPGRTDPPANLSPANPIPLPSPTQARAGYMVHRHAACPLDRRPRDQRGPQARRVSLIRVPDGPVPPGQDVHVAAQTRRAHAPPPDTGTEPSPSWRPGKHRAAGPGDEPVRSTGTIARHRRMMRPRRSSWASRRRPLPRLRQARQLPPGPYRHPIPGEGKTDDGLAAYPAGRWQPGQQDVQVGLFDLLAIGAVLGGDPQRPPLVPQKGPLVAQLADPV